MTKEYTGFPIANFRVGFNEALEPWLIPRDAFQVLKNAHLYRGVVEKISGYNLFATMSNRGSVRSSTGTIDGVNKTFTGTLPSFPWTTNITAQSTIDSGATTVETFSYSGPGTFPNSINLMSSGGTPGSGLILSGGQWTLNFKTAPADLTVGGIQYNSVVLTDDFSPGMQQPIMGIKPFINSNGSQDVLVFNTKRAAKIVVLGEPTATNAGADYGTSEIPHETQSLAITTGFNNTVGPFTGTVNTFLVPGSVQFDIYTDTTATATLWTTVTDNGASLLTDTAGFLDPGVLNLINYATGQWTMQFLSGSKPLSTYQTNFSGSIYGDTFTGDFTNFFDVVNYQGKAFFTNGVDAPGYYDGSSLQYLNTNQSAKPNTVAPYDLSRVLHMYASRERLLLMAPYLNNVPVLNGIYWSTAGAPLDFTNNEQLLAPTSEPIKAFSEINSDVVVRFSNSERVFRYTADAFSPFRWDPTNVIWRCDAPYSTINYDSWFSSVGLPAIVGSDGVNVKRADEIIPDFTLNLRIAEQQPVLSIDQGSIGQCYGERFDDFKEGWLCYKNFDDGEVDGVKPSDSVLAFNYLDSTYAVYTFPFSCLGFGRLIVEDVWGNNFDKWYAANYAWNSYSQTDGALIDLAGDQNGKIYELGVGNDITDMQGNVIPCLFEAITKDFNPFIEGGELARLGYVDFLVSSNDDTTFRVQFYKDNQLDDDFDTFYQETSLTLTGNTQSKIWKRIYVGAVGKEHTLRIYQNADDFATGQENQPIRIHAMVPYFKAAGRIFG